MGNGSSCPTAPTFPNTVSNCNLWHTVVSGDTCWDIWQKFSITQQQFVSWNPSVSSDCLTNFWLGQAYCVGTGVNQCTTSSSSSSSTATLTSSTTTSQSTITTSSKTSTTSFSSTSYSTRHPITSMTNSAIPIDGEWPPTRTKGGQHGGCDNWHRVNQGDTCDSIARAYAARMTEDELLAWNPTLGADCSGLFNGWWVCVGILLQTSLTLTWSPPAVNASIPSPTIPIITPTTSIDYAFTPSPTQAGIPSGCESFWKANAGDSCLEILSQIPWVSQQQFFSWNPSLNGNCNGLWQNYYYCVANYGGHPPLPTVTVQPTNRALGIIDLCTSWYFATGDDTCDSIAEMLNILTPAEFKLWNPSVGPICGNLVTNLYYCVGIPGSPTSPTTTQAPPAIPTGGTLPSACTDEWIVGLSDTCETIARANHISVTQLMAWNPWLLDSGTITSGCLPEPGTTICVAVPSTTTSTDLFDTEPTDEPESSTTSTSSRTTTSSSSTSTTSPSSTTTTSFCQQGYGPGGYAGLCDASCFHGFCPPPCTCTEYGPVAREAPQTPGVHGYRLLGLPADYEELCEWSCSRWWCPEEQCTRTPYTEVPSPGGSACVQGTGVGGLLGLCDFACRYDYCPTGSCTCTMYGAPFVAPPGVANPGVPVAGLEDPDSYLGLCAYGCARGYCPPEVCVIPP